MVTNTSIRHDLHEYQGLSTDTKPTGDIPNGSSFFEMDTFNVFFWDADSQTWINSDSDSEEE